MLVARGEARGIAWRLGAAFLLAAALRGILLVALVADLGVGAPLAVAIAVVPSWAGVRAALPRIRIPGPGLEREDVPGWRGLGVLVVGSGLLLRLAAAGTVDLMPEEAYYWNYGEHPALGYLDHPPVVGWSIRLGTEIVGKGELGVRLPALLFWAVAALFVFRLTVNLFSRAAAWRALILFSALPFTFSVGLLSTPDSPLVACWAGALFFLERALLGGRRGAWLGAGACLGVGMASKYTIALIGGATVLFLLLDRPSRRWLLRPEPWLGLALAALLFSPVVVWNVRNDWASFAFQGARRWADGGDFSLHHLTGSIAVLLTPIGFLAAFAALLPRPDPDRDAPRRQRFARVFVLAPLLVLAFFALDHQPKLNWSGPIFLAAIPFMADRMGGGPGLPDRLARWVWLPTVTVTLLVLAAGTWWILLAMPGMSTLSRHDAPVAWSEWGETVDAIAAEVRAETGEEPIRTGMDPYFQSAEMSFYTEGPGPAVTAGRQVLSRRSGLMWDRWTPRESIVGRTVVAVSDDRGDLKSRRFERHFRRVTGIREAAVVKRGKRVVTLFYRIGYGYRLEPEDAPGPDSAETPAGSRRPR